MLAVIRVIASQPLFPKYINRLTFELFGAKKLTADMLCLEHEQVGLWIEEIQLSCRLCNSIVFSGGVTLGRSVDVVFLFHR